MKRNLRKERECEERYAEIERENGILLGKMILMRKSKKNATAPPTNPLRKLEYDKEQKILKLIKDQEDQAKRRKTIKEIKKKKDDEEFHKYVKDGLNEKVEKNEKKYFKYTKDLTIQRSIEVIKLIE